MKSPANILRDEAKAIRRQLRTAQSSADAGDWFEVREQLNFLAEALKSMYQAAADGAGPLERVLDRMVAPAEPLTADVACDQCGVIQPAGMPVYCMPERDGNTDPWWCRVCGRAAGLIEVPWDMPHEERVVLAKRMVGSLAGPTGGQ